MDYSNSDMEVPESADTFEEPEIIEDTTEGVEPVTTEIEPEVEPQADAGSAIDSTDVPADLPTDQVPDNPGFHSQPEGFEVPSSPETETLEAPNIREPEYHGGGPEGGC